MTKATQPRVNLTLSAETIAAIDDLADAVGKPRATVAAGLLDEMRDQLPAIAKMARAAKSGDRQAVRQSIRHLFGDAAAELMTATQTDLFKVKRKGRRQ